MDRDDEVRNEKRGSYRSCHKLSLQVITFYYSRSTTFLPQCTMALQPLTRQLPQIRRGTLPSTRGFSSNDLASRAPPRQQHPPPGRLARAPRSSPATAGENESSSRIEAEKAKSSRIEERKKAIERRRLFLEKGVTSPVQEPITVIYEQKEQDAGTLSSSLESNVTSTNPPKLTRSSVHSLNEGRKLSAADLHRLQRTSQRSELTKQQGQETSRSVQKVQHPQQNRVEHRLHREVRTNPTGGSIVAAQSATARYRMQRQQQKESGDTESNLKMNPSVISIPLDERDTAPVVDDFEERLKKLRRDKQKEEKEETSGWFGWLWK